MPERLEEPKPALTAERDLAQPVQRASVTKVALPEKVRWTVVLLGREFQCSRPLADVPAAVQDYMLSVGAQDAAMLLRD